MSVLSGVKYLLFPVGKGPSFVALSITLNWMSCHVD